MPSSSLTPPRSCLTIDLRAIAANWRDLAGRAGTAECAAAVKADAYGLGTERVAPALWAAGCRTYFVASIEEAVRLRGLLADATIAVLDGALAGSEEDLVAHGLAPVLNDLGQVERWHETVRRAGRSLPALLHVDTGINRLGLSAVQLDRLTESAHLLDGPDWRALMTHLACADDPDDPMNRTQRDRLLSIRDRLPRMPLSLANSGGVLLGPDYHLDLMRPGIALFGGRAVGTGPSPMRPVVTLEARVLQIPAGEGVGYGVTHRFEAPARVATIATGYADGYLRSGGGKASVAFGGVRAPVVGRVSMDMIAVDVSALGPAGPKPGDMVELIGPTVPLDAVADAAGTIGYEILTALGRRHERRYTDDPGR
jgi:alanine racemase